MVGISCCDVSLDNLAHVSLIILVIAGELIFVIQLYGIVVMLSDVSIELIAYEFFNSVVY